MSSRFEQLLKMADEALYCAKESVVRAMIAGQHQSAARLLVARSSIRPHRILA